MGPESLPLWLPLPEYAGLMAHNPTASYDAGLVTRPVAATARDTLRWLDQHPEAVVTGIGRDREAEVLAAWHASEGIACPRDPTEPRPPADRPGLRRGFLGLLGRAARARRDLAERTPRSSRRPGEERDGRVGAQRRRPDARAQGVRSSLGEFGFLAGSIGRASADRLVLAIERATARGPAAAGGADQRRHPDAGGHAGVRADGADLAGGGRAQDGGAALPRLPAPPHDRRSDGVVGLARARHGRRARRAGRLPRAARLRSALRQAVPGRRADRREPLRPRDHRRGRRPTSRSPTSSIARCRSCSRRATASRWCPLRRRTSSPTSTPGTRSRGHDGRTGPAYDDC